MTDNLFKPQRWLRTFLRQSSHLPRMSFDFHPKGLFHIPHLRYKRLWVYIGLAMIFGVLSLSLIDVPRSIQVFLWSDKLAHGVAYAGLMGWFAQIYRHDLTRLALVAGFVAFGIGIEYLQAMTPTRHFDVSDMVANTCGIVLAWALSYTLMGKILEKIETFPPFKTSKVEPQGN